VSVSAVTDIVAIYLARCGTGLDALSELRSRVELGLVALAIDRLDDEGSAMLDEASRLGERSQPMDIAVHDLHVALAALAGNPVLELIALVLIRLTQFHQHRDLTEDQSREVEQDIQVAHMAIVRAVQSGDLEIARKRMRVHLDAMSAFLR
jgi:DNA-binding FadR family transcriptional regulator